MDFVLFLDFRLKEAAAATAAVCLILWLLGVPRGKGRFLSWPLAAAGLFWLWRCLSEAPRQARFFYETAKGDIWDLAKEDMTAAVILFAAVCSLFLYLLTYVLRMTGLFFIISIPMVFLGPLLGQKLDLAEISLLAAFHIGTWVLGAGCHRRDLGIRGELAGALLTAVIQSSSASVGILQALCATGSVTYAAAVPIIMGQNIGTCVTAMISSIGTSKNARRAALVHLYFNLIGTAAFLILFYALQSLVGFSFLGDAASPAGIAAVHSVFNIFATVILLPFAKGLEKLAFLTVKEEAGQEIRPQESSDLMHLDIRFLDQPGFAVIQCRRVAVHMARMAQEALSEAVELLGNYQEDKARKVIELEAQVDHYEDQLESYLVKLSGKDLSVKDSHTLSILLHSIGDFERISDHALNIMEGAQKMHRQQMVFSGKASRELKVFTGAVQEIVATAVDVFENEDSHLAEFIEPLEEVIDSLQEELKMRHIMRLRDGRCTIDLGVILSDFITDFERVADHCSNVAVCVIQIQEGGYDAHEYLELLRQPENVTFKENVLRYAKKYTLP